jgi:carboxyl-terminal processing protease
MKAMRIFSIFILLAAAAIINAQPLTDEAKASILEAVSKNIKERAYVAGVDFSKWDSFVEKHKERFDAAKTQDQFAQAVNIAFVEFGFSHIRLLTPRQAETTITGQSVGIGIMAGVEEGGIRVGRVIEGGPAQKAGIKVGDLIIKVNGEDAKSPEQIRGEKGTDVKLHVKREDGTVVEMTITRDTFNVNVKDELKWIDDKTAHLKVNTFMNGYDRKLIDEFFKEIEEKKAEKLILDLRSNGGGSTFNLYHLAGKVLPNQASLGKFITRNHADRYKAKYEGKGDDPIEVSKEFGMELKALGTSEHFKGSIVVLISGASGSATEILASAIQDHARGKLLGTNSAGAVLASTFFQLPERFSLQLPLMEYVTVSSKRLEGTGVKPDIVLEPAETANDEKILKLANETLSNIIKNKEGKTNEIKDGSLLTP